MWIGHDVTGRPHGQGSKFKEKSSTPLEHACGRLQKDQTKVKTWCVAEQFRMFDAKVFWSPDKWLCGHSTALDQVGAYRKAVRRSGLPVSGETHKIYDILPDSKKTMPWFTGTSQARLYRAMVDRRTRGRGSSSSQIAEKAGGPRPSA